MQPIQPLWIPHWFANHEAIFVMCPLILAPPLHYTSHLPPPFLQGGGQELDHSLLSQHKIVFLCILVVRITSTAHAPAYS